MRILRVSNRYFLVESDKDIERVALRVLNEARVLDEFEGQTKLFVDQICDAQDGDLAVNVMGRLLDVELIAPEIV